MQQLRFTEEPRWRWRGPIQNDILMPQPPFKGAIKREETAIRTST